MRTMNAIRALAALLVLACLQLPTATAQDAPLPPGCDEEDLDGFSFSFLHRDGTSETADTLEPAQEGDDILATGSADAECDGATVTLTTYMVLEDGWVVYDENERVFFQPRAGTDFVIVELFVRVPQCQFAIELTFGDGGAILLDSTEGGEADCDALPVPECVTDLYAEATEQGIIVGYTESDNASEFRIYRAEGDGELTLFGSLGAGEGSFVDGTVEAGQVYRYQIRAANHNGEAQDCPIVEATAVPFFGAPLFGALAMLGAVAMYAVMRRK